MLSLLSSLLARTLKMIRSSRLSRHTHRLVSPNSFRPQTITSCATKNSKKSKSKTPLIECWNKRWNKTLSEQTYQTQHSCSTNRHRSLNRKDPQWNHLSKDQQSTLGSSRHRVRNLRLSSLRRLLPQRARRQSAVLQRPTVMKDLVMMRAQRLRLKERRRIVWKSRKLHNKRSEWAWTWHWNLASRKSILWRVLHPLNPIVGAPCDQNL